MSFLPSRGNKHRRGAWRPSNPRTSTANDSTATPAPPFGDLLDEIRLEDLERTANGFSDSSTIRDSVVEASFNWIRTTNTGKPTIVIPGSPPRWTYHKSSMQLREDQGKFFRDRNAAQYPRHPMEPAIAAGIHCNPNLAMGIDIVACSSTLGNLLRFVRQQEKSFRILVELVDETLFLIRRENSPTELIDGVRGFGHSFPEAYTTWDSDVKQSTSHQRLLRYNFGGLHLLVRFEADGYLPLPKNEASKPVTSLAKPSGHFNFESLAKSFEAAKVDPEEYLALSSSTNDKLVAKQAGRAVGQDRVFDLKTRSIWKKDRDLLSEEIPRLWLAQISNFVVAYHEKGVFKPENVLVRDVKQDVAKWETEQDAVLAQLAALLHTLISKAREQKDGKFEIRRTEKGDFELRGQLNDAGEVLSQGVRKQWIRSSKKEAGSEKVDAMDATNTLLWDDGTCDYTACTDACQYCGHCTY
ncbi:hypothetical protein VTL71DRAFT_8032 [Oculimacula yallundae]|uniref:Geranylgeranyl pyrophosphate synthetase n=1 Tax=Oculimacula yallundae TaxID=86028 RepID=A0ABR4CYW0_9HELO